ncbi:dihydrolipoyl dehydrogenase family protein [Flexibacterium corallicola]|uniref:dihydrolipoyl dehydrogenase family protein n=1 Tax=Flexibacterium corallicola TaxID=3037259 RepID=UPI00286FA48D|nr:FAD-dependent oxidoreductase [Pseudovibrio sp. M1P-2-3]
MKPDICVIGAGAAGLTVAAAAASFGVRVVLVENGKMGGDCLNYGCVPSKSLLAVAKNVQEQRDGVRFGMSVNEPEVDYGAASTFLHGVIDQIAPHDSQERFEGLGVTVLRSEGRFTSPSSLQVGELEVKARRFVVATGSRASIPEINGLDSVPYLTNETLFDLQEKPEHLIIVGGGAIGMEMAQAHARLGSQVTVIEAGKALSKMDADLCAVVLSSLRKEGVTILDNANIERVRKSGRGLSVELRHEDRGVGIEGSHLLIAAGRQANVEKLCLDQAEVQCNQSGIQVNKGLRTSNPKIYAIGDVTGGLQFTHLAGAQGALAIKSLLFRLPVNAHNLLTPRTLYTDPEIVEVGLSEAEAREKHGRFLKVLTSSFSENDRALSSGKKEGFVKLLVGRGGRLLGAGIVGDNAGELINVLSLMISKKMGVGALLGLVMPYPTRSEAIKRAALSYYADVPKKSVLRGALRILRLFG